MTIVNTHQSEAWNGYEGGHWAEHRDRYDAVNQGFNKYLLDHVQDGDRVLDVGCGAGQVTRVAARRARHVTGVDLSEPMLGAARAAALAEGVDGVEFVRADAQVHPFPRGAFDLAVSRFGIMFFADPVAAFANIGRALRPGGRLALLSLRAMADHEVSAVFAAMDAHLPPPPAPEPGSGDGPVSLSDPERVHEVFTEAGFTGVAATPVDAEQIWGRDAEDAAGFLLGWGPVRFHLRHADAGAAARARAAAVPALRPFERDGAVRLRGAAYLITATRP
ncbi:methyltransferase domain-containing protein [Spongiactinospora sp. TRM90649]|uniref:methyltransferase domain-containing protein n=1 Tax=Spongiactinospora sp. TRM90649 TaxID=3031114 RepID=UPI0023F7A0DE|nr:methyltransferase domain-containing protein [Spongiactinospora sp. TRM90649]MDF5756373.1 methyltransferase domain-containing protein [Spongiactinospora sp. TRM90649]